MAAIDASLSNDVLNSLQGDLKDIKVDMASVKLDMRSIMGNMASFLVNEVAQDTTMAQMLERIERIEARLNLSEG